jgi:hypothetical protein
LAAIPVPPGKEADKQIKVVAFTRAKTQQSTRNNI